MESPTGVTGPVNLGNPTEFTMRELAEIVLAETGTRSPIVTRPLPEDDPKQRCPDITLAKRLFDWIPTVPLREGIKPTISYFRSFDWPAPLAVGARQ
jgi:UDP-glucuronate decarboxylase